MSTDKDNSKLEIEDHRAFFLAQRDKHLDQYMAINTRAAFAAIVLFVGAIFRAGSIKIELEPFSVIFLAFVGLAGACLFGSAFLFHKFYTYRIREFERKAYDSTSDPEEKDFLIIPDEDDEAFFLAFVGVLLVLGAAITILIRV